MTTALPPPPPAEFEVADIRPTAPGATGARLQLQPNGRLDGQNIPLKAYINLAWNINSDELIGGLPKFAENARFDIVAKTSTTPGGQIDIDSLRLMLQKLLADRFKMTTHMEDRPVSGYVLTAVKPKLQKADPESRTGCAEPPPGVADSKDPRVANPVLSRYLTCHNMTIAQLAEQLPSLANGYVQTPVLDSTGLTDAYDFTLSFSAAGLLRRRFAWPASACPGRYGSIGAQRRDLASRGCEQATGTQDGVAETSAARSGDRSHRRRSRPKTDYEKTRGFCVLGVRAGNSLKRSPRLRSRR